MNPSEVSVQENKVSERIEPNVLLQQTDLWLGRVILSQW
jgi:hypothetical protein